jgi:ferric-dicitrate binding protein FerR (iron transport regulator)
MDATTIARYLNGEMNKAEKQALLAWVKAHPDNKRLFAAMKNAWSLAAMNRLSGQDAPLTQERWQQVQTLAAAKKATPLRVFRRFMQAAAIIAVLIATGYLLRPYLFKPAPVAYHTIKVPAGERLRLVLADSSIVWLNAGSQLQYPAVFDEHKREVLLNGEGFFEVRQNSGSPFTVKTTLSTITVLGTSFNVYAFPSEPVQQVILINGKLSVAKTGIHHRQLLAPGQMASIQRNQDSILVSQVNPDDYVGWRSGAFQFQQLSFRDLALRLERTFNVHIIFERTSLMNHTFSGSFYGNESLELILKMMQASTPFRFETRKDTVLIR